MSENQIKSNHIRFGETVSFQAGSGIDSFLLDGWSGQEPNHRWTDSGCAGLQLHLSELGAKNIMLRVECLGLLLVGKLEHQFVEVLVNDNKVATWTVRKQAWHEAVVPNELIKNGDMNVSFFISNPTAPFDGNLSDDKRKLGLCVLSIEIIEIMESGDSNSDTSAATISVNAPDNKNVNNYKAIFKNKLAFQGSFPECYAFSMHKAGSSLMHAMINQVCHLANIAGFSIPDTLFMEGIFENVWGNDERILDLIGSGRIYYGFRHLPKVLLNESVHLRKKKSVLLIRDPRDALVSQYFSYGGKNISHRLPDKNKDVFLEKAQNTSHMDIDQYVLTVAAGYRNKLKIYKDNLNFDNVLLFKYEDIYFDKRKFLEDIFNHFGIAVESTLLDEVAARHDVRPEVEDVAKHIRKGTPGDHVDKLRPETINKLNDI